MNVEAQLMQLVIGLVGGKANFYLISIFVFTISATYHIWKEYKKDKRR